MIKFIKRFLSNIEYKWSYLNVINSPFKGLKLKWYFGKIQYGIPYFLPRKLVKMNREDAIKSANEALSRKFPDKRSFDELVEYYLKHKKFSPIKYFGWNSATLGWKTKWDDYRFEWNPMYSLVIFGKQLYVLVIPNIDKECMYDIYWEAWLNYRYKTDKSKSKQERLKQLRDIYSCTWSDGKKTTDYYPYILKNKYNVN